MYTPRRQMQIATAKITSNNELIEDKKREKDHPESDQEKNNELENEIKELEEESKVQKDLINDLKPALKNQLDSIREQFIKCYTLTKHLGRNLKLCLENKLSR